MLTLQIPIPRLDTSMQTDRHRWPESLDWTLESGPDDAPDSTDVVVPYSYSGGCSDYFSGGCWNPGDPAEVEIGTPWYVSDGVMVEVNLTEAEMDRVTTYILENPPEPYDPEDW